MRSPAFVQKAAKREDDRQELLSKVRQQHTSEIGVLTVEKGPGTLRFVTVFADQLPENEDSVNLNDKQAYLIGPTVRPPTTDVSDLDTGIKHAGSLRRIIGRHPRNCMRPSIPWLPALSHSLHSCSALMSIQRI